MHGAVISCVCTETVAKLEAMSKVEQIELQVSELSQRDLAHFRTWYAAFDADAWDHQLEQDVTAGKLDQLAERALRAHASGSTKSL